MSGVARSTLVAVVNGIKGVRMSDCLFCKIVRGEIPCDKVYEDDEVLAFHDIHPVAPVHFMLIPKLHLASLAQAEQGKEFFRQNPVSRPVFRVVLDFVALAERCLVRREA